MKWHWYLELLRKYDGDMSKASVNEIETADYLAVHQTESDHRNLSDGDKRSLAFDDARKMYDSEIKIEKKIKKLRQRPLIQEAIFKMLAKGLSKENKGVWICSNLCEIGGCGNCTCCGGNMMHVTIDKQFVEFKPRKGEE